MSEAVRRRGLGRGLEALLGDAPVTHQTAAPDGDGASTAGIDEIWRSPFQPRRRIDDEGIEDLAASIRSQGLLQPVVVRHRAAGGFELIAGERRWRAAQRAGLERVPVVVRDVDDRGALAMALIENVQREDLNPIEEAQGLERLRQEFELTQEQVAEAVGKSRPAVANLLRLLNLPEAVCELLAQGDLEMGHARALLALPVEDQEPMARVVVKGQLSVRQTEALVRRAAKKPEPRPTAVDPDIRRLEIRLSERLGAGVSINHTRKGGGKVVIAYASLDELDGILSRLG
ncbi:MAG: ParB/RepB/Spo0J family partition protein [Gammaproteobacteria bacterium]|nr:ParB/RepB/Spo0J family partition protein [Gammaproteobacteria bacterium]